MNPRDASASKKSWMDGWDRSCQPRPISWSPVDDKNVVDDIEAYKRWLSRWSWSWWTTRMRRWSAKSTSFFMIVKKWARPRSGHLKKIPIEASDSWKKLLTLFKAFNTFKFVGHPVDIDFDVYVDRGCVTQGET